MVTVGCSVLLMQVPLLQTVGIRQTCMLTDVMVTE
jgi:hypothetical protein